MGNPGIFISPSKYIQGAGVLSEIGKFVLPFGSNVLTVGGKRGLDVTRAVRTSSFKTFGIAETELIFSGETCDTEIARISDTARSCSCEVIMAVGGGKAIDAVKAASAKAGTSVIIAPTIASNDAPCSALAIIYNEDGAFLRRDILPRNPDLVIADTAIISQAPPRYLAAGMGDALATYFEADACRRSGACNLSGGRATLAALALARLCYDTLLKSGKPALDACERGIVIPELEEVVEVNTLLSGLGFESCGVAAAHALAEGFSAVPELHTLPHGYAVAFGLIVQLIIESHEKLYEVIDFNISTGLPVTLSELGTHDDAAIRQAITVAMSEGSPVYNMPLTVTADTLYESIAAADTIGCWAKNHAQLGYTARSRC